MAAIEIFNPMESVDGTTVSDGIAVQMFRVKYTGKLLYSEDEGRWYRYNGHIWQKERKSFAYEICHKLGLELSANNPKNIKELQSAKFAKAVESLIAAQDDFNRTIEKWDQDPFLAGEPRLTMDLRGADTRRPTPDDMITRSVSVSPTEIEDCPLWIKFLEDATGNDQELITFLQRWVGYCLTGDTREHALVFIYGGGGNGKSVFVNTIMGIFGDYAAVASMDTFTASKNDKHPTDIAMLRGARLVTASETEEGRSWDEARLKQMTGGDPISARFMRQDFFTFRPQFKLMIIGNHQPVLQNVDDAMRRRFCMVPFTIKPETPDPQLEEKLKKEWPAILRWALNGCRDWQRNGLPRPASVLAATAEYFDDQDVMSQWMEQACTVDIGNPYRKSSSSDLFESWSIHAKRAGILPGSIRGFSQKLVNRGLKKTRPKTGTVFEGIDINRNSIPYD